MNVCKICSHCFSFQTTGVRRIKEYYKDSKTKPQFLISDNSILVVLPKVQFSEETVGLDMTGRMDHLPERVRQIYGLIREREPITRSEIEKLNSSFGFRPVITNHPTKSKSISSRIIRSSIQKNIDAIICIIQRCLEISESDFKKSCIQTEEVTQCQCELNSGLKPIIQIEEYAPSKSHDR